MLAKIADAKDVAAALDGFNPQQPGYKALKAKLAEARGKAEDAGPARIAGGPVLKLVTDKKRKTVLMQDPRVPLLRERLGLAGRRRTTPFYDKPLVDAVEDVPEASNGLHGQRSAHAGDVDALNGPKRDKVDRHHPRQHGALALDAARSRQEPT